MADSSTVCRFLLPASSTRLSRLAMISPAPTQSWLGCLRAPCVYQTSHTEHIASTGTPCLTMRHTSAAAPAAGQGAERRIGRPSSSVEAASQQGCAWAAGRGRRAHRSSAQSPDRGGDQPHPGRASAAPRCGRPACSAGGPAAARAWPPGLSPPSAAVPSLSPCSRPHVCSRPPARMGFRLKWPSTCMWRVIVEWRSSCCEHRRSASVSAEASMWLPHFATQTGIQHVYVHLLMLACVTMTIIHRTAACLHHTRGPEEEAGREQTGLGRG